MEFPQLYAAIVACFFIVVCSTAELPCSPPCQNGVCQADHGRLSCSCQPNWFGDACNISVCERESGYCENGGTCVINPSNSSVAGCICPPYFAGDRCQLIPHHDDCRNYSCGSGDCYGSADGPKCVCPEDRFGPNCNFRGSDPCKDRRVQDCFHHGRCSHDPNGRLVCDCEPGYQGLFNCERPESRNNTCLPDPGPCGNGGTCNPFVNFHTCTCPASFTGENCMEEFDVCENACENGGICSPIAEGHYFSCSCPSKYTGQRCETLLESDSNSTTCPHQYCLNNGTCKVVNDSLACGCVGGFGGDRCEVLDRCASSPCSNNTRPPHCCNNAGGYECVCADGWEGPLCDVDVNECQRSPCGDGECINVPGGFRCECSHGTTGPTCETALMTNCSAELCSEGGECQVNSKGIVFCHCFVGFTGSNCEVPLCSRPECRSLAGNGQCNEQCNVKECGFDGLDCNVVEVNPWDNCPRAAFCSRRYRDGVCHVECNVPECLYDGMECSPTVQECNRSQECQRLVEDGTCQSQCYTSQCLYDFQDCQNQNHNFVKNRLVLVLFSHPNEPFTGQRKLEFLQALGKLTNSIPVLEDVKNLTSRDLQQQNILPPADPNQLIYQVTVRLDISQCRFQCPTNAQDAVDWIYAAIASGSPDLGPFSVQNAKSEGDPPFPWYYVVVGVALLFVVLSIGVVGIILGKRKRVTAKIWRPTSPSSEGDHASPRTATGWQSSSRASDSFDEKLDSKDYMETGAKKAKMTSKPGFVKWEDDKLQDSTDSTGVVIGQRGRDAREWGVMHTQDVSKLIEQYKRHNGSGNLNVNAPGPGGFTPLMLAVMRRRGAYSYLNCQSRSSSESSSDDQTALIPSVPLGTPRHLMFPPVDRSVTDLLDAKANLDCTNDYDQTALHLAAATSRPEYVDMLMEAGANPNIQDKWGQTPLHAAIGAGGEGSFMVLLNYPQTKINIKSDGGITPLMAAVKMVNGFMVKQLLKKDSELISTTDNEGRTAVHWAAMVDNVEALRMLVSRGPDTIKDAQDHKGQTALFLACREGSVMCTKHLLDCFANATLFDNLDQSPMQIAMKNQYSDIVELLRASSHGPMPPYRLMPAGPGYPMSAEMASYPASQPPQQQLLVTPPTSNKRKKSKLPASNGQLHGKYKQQQSSYSPSSQLHNESIAMSELHHNAPSSTHPPYTSHHSPPHFPTPLTSSNYPSATATSVHSPPLPPHCQPPVTSAHYPSSSSTHVDTSCVTTPGPDHPTYSISTPTTSGYSNPTPPTYDPHHQHPILAEDSSGSIPHTTVSSSLPHHSMMEGYPIYPGAAANVGMGTQPLQHFTGAEMYPVSTSVGVGSDPAGTATTSYVPTAHSPPQSGGSISQNSPVSTFHSPPNSYNSPQSLTPSPDSQSAGTTNSVLNALGTVHVEVPYNYHHHNMYQQMMGSTPV